MSNDSSESKPAVPEAGDGLGDEATDVEREGDTPRATDVEGFEGLHDISSEELVDREREIDSSDEVYGTDSIEAEKIESLFEEDESIPTLIVLAGSKAGQTTHLEPGRTILGRDRESVDMIFRDGGVSREHAALEVTDDDGVWVHDLDSSNGTFVNGERIDGDRKLEDGDKITLGKRTMLKFSVLDQFDEQFQQRMYESAIRDDLTGAYSRAYLEEQMRAEMSFADRHETPVAILLFDIDHFKGVNDVYGHVAGNEILEQFAEAVEGELRTEDLLGRFGGDEFLILLRETDEEEAVEAAERICDAVRDSTFEVEGAQISLTVSVGVAPYDAESMSKPDAWFRAADSALYDAKENGRDSVEVC